MTKRRPAASASAPAPPPVLRRCRVHTSVHAPRYEYGRTLAPDQLVNLDDPIAEGVTLRAFVRDEWFDPPPAAEAPAPSAVTEDEETSDGIASRT